MGMSGVMARFERLNFLEALPKGAAVCDIIYSPPETMLLARARALGHPTLNGLGMLIYQAIFALEEFTDSKIDAQKVLPAVKTALDEAMKV